jgi:hypothetical protein
VSVDIEIVSTAGSHAATEVLVALGVTLGRVPLWWPPEGEPEPPEHETAITTITIAKKPPSAARRIQ